MKRNRLLFLLALLTAAAGAWAQGTATTSATRSGSDNTYKVKMKEGTKDAAKWTIASDGNSTTGDKTDGLTVAPEKEVTLTYSGRLKVKSVTATHDGWDGDLSNIPASLIGSDRHTVIVPDGTTLTGDLDGSTTPYKIVIPDGATVTLAGVDIDGENNENYKWAGINCEGDATIILADNTTNEVEGFCSNYPGIHIVEGKTLIIKGGNLGSGELEAKGYGPGCGIGGGSNIACGNIIIEGGNIKAEGGDDAAGIGSGRDSSCGDITISGGIFEASYEGRTAAIGSGYKGRCGNILINGGIITANGGYYSAAIGSGYEASCGDITISGGTVTANGYLFGCGIGCGEGASCGNITITKDVTLLTATKGEDSPNSIGLGYSGNECGTVTIGCELDSEGKPKSGTGTVYFDGETKSYQNVGDVYLAQSPLTLVNLGKLTGNYEAPNGTTLFGTLNGSEQPYKVSIADGATVKLDGVDIEGVNDANCKWAGLTCAGDATIILNDGSENTVMGFDNYYPGILVPSKKKLTIKGGNVGNGKLTASPFDGGTDKSYGAGIGGGNITNCGAIEIQGGIITANGGSCAAGIGGGDYASWGEITISGGNVSAKGGQYAAGIGSGRRGGEISYGNISITGGTVEAIGGDLGAGIGSGLGTLNESNHPNALCGDIFISGGSVYATGGEKAAGIGTGFQYSKCLSIAITTGVDIVTATRGKSAIFSIGRSSADNNRHNSCGMIYIGCTLDNGNPVGGTMYTDIGDSPFTYPPSH